MMPFGKIQVCVGVFCSRPCCSTIQPVAYGRQIVSYVGYGIQQVLAKRLDGLWAARRDDIHFRRGLVKCSM